MQLAELADILRKGFSPRPQIPGEIAGEGIPVRPSWLLVQGKQARFLLDLRTVVVQGSRARPYYGYPE
jgi:hypothetical protein